MAVSILSSLGDYVINIEITSWESNHSGDREYGLWLLGRVTVLAPGYQAELSLNPQLDDFSNFLAALENAQTDRFGDFSFTMAEATLDVRGQLNQRGSIIWQVATRHPDDARNALQLYFSGDQSQLPYLIKDLRRVLKQYPAETPVAE